MAVARKWSGDNVGGLDSTFQTLSAANVYEAAGSGNTRLAIGATANSPVAFSPLGALAQSSGVMELELVALPSGTAVLMAPLTAGGAQAWRVLVLATGQLRIQDSASATIATSAAGAVLMTGVKYRVSWSHTATSFSLGAVNIGTGATTISLSASTGSYGAVDNMRLGNTISTPLVAWKLDRLQLGDTATIPTDGGVNPPLAGTPKIAVIGDSLTNMAPDGTTILGEGQTLVAQALTSRGYDTRNVYFWGVGGKRIQVADLTTRTFAQNWADCRAFFGGTDPDYLIVALGTNDRGQTDATVNSAVDSLLSTVGTGPTIRWIGLTSKVLSSTDDTRLNGLIASKLAARGNATIADWAGFIHNGRDESGLWQASDSTHMTHDGYVIRSGFYAQQLPDTSAPPAYSGSATAQAAVAVSASGRPRIVGAGPVAASAVASASGRPRASGSASAGVSAVLSAVGRPRVSASGPIQAEVSCTAIGAPRFAGAVSIAAEAAAAAMHTVPFRDVDFTVRLRGRGGTVVLRGSGFRARLKEGV